MRKKYFVLTVLAITISCLYCLNGMADAAYLVKNQMIKEARVIALVNIESVNKSFNRKEAKIAAVIDDIKKELGSGALGQTPPRILSVANAAFVCSGGLGRGCFNRIRSKRSHFKEILL